jgi:hypothetical protein
MQGFDPAKSSRFGDGSLCMVAASAEKGQVLGWAKVGQALCATPAIVDGRLVNGIACYDLRRP